MATLSLSKENKWATKQKNPDSKTAKEISKKQTTKLVWDEDKSEWFG